MITYKIKAGTEIAELLKWCDRQIAHAELNERNATRQAEKTGAHHEAIAYRNTRDFWSKVVVVDGQSEAEAAGMTKNETAILQDYKTGD